LIEDFFSASDGLRLAERRWNPGGAPRATVILVHGFTEHSGRYASTAAALNHCGYAVAASDLRGHGKSAGSRCFVRTFDDYIDDLECFYQRIGHGAGEKPVFVLGHSLGGLIAVLWSVRYRPKLNGLLLSGPALQVRRQLLPWLRRFARVGSMFFPRLRLIRLGYRSISRDPAVVVQFRDDPLVFHGRFPVRTGAEILRACDLAQAAQQHVRTPFLILHGTADRVAAVEASQQLLRRAEATDKMLHLYPDLYHEVLNEPEKEQVLTDLIHWIDARTN
jgi:acylglycerol lipase